MRHWALLLALGAGVCQAESLVENLTYARVGELDLALDLYLPERPEPAPLVLHVHGGGWRAGDKSSGVPLAFVEAGFAVASLDFRQSTQAPFPAQVHDIKAALRYLRAHADAQGYDARRIAITGVSSGAHLALLAGVSNGHAELEGELGEHLDQSSDVQAIISYFGASDLSTILAQSTPFGLSLREPALAQLLGGAPDTLPELTALASPVRHVDAGDPPLLLFHGDLDPQMPVNQSLQMQGAYLAQGLEVDFVAVHGAGHGGPEFFTPDNLERALTFLQRQLGEPPKD